MREDDQLYGCFIGNLLTFTLRGCKGRYCRFGLGLVYGALRHFQQYFSYIVARGVARISKKYRHKLFRRGVCVPLKVGGTKGGTP